MAEYFEALNDKLIAFIEAQPMFFIASAVRLGRVNLSPKGLDTFRVFGPNLVAYLDITGSGNETAAHARADGRATIMFCSFTRNPLVLRLYGRTRTGAPAARSGATTKTGLRSWPAPGRSSRSISIPCILPAASACR
jgi:hypothetical protein